MKKLVLLILGFVMFKTGYAQYPMTQFIGTDSAVVISKGAMQSRFINVVFADTTAANSQRVRQYPGAMIYASGKMWVRNTTATAWVELAYGPVSSTNIYNSDGTLTGPRTLDGNNDDLTFDNMGFFTVNANPLGQIRFYQGSNSNILMRGDTTAISRRLSYNTNLASSFTKHTLVDKNYVDSSITASPSGTVTSVATNNGTGITGGTITTTGTLAIDTSLISTRAWRQKGIDSVASLPKVTSVGLSMPAAFNVANSPVTSSGTLTVTGAGLASQYIRGDGTLANFPGGGGSGGGSSVSYYLNGSVNQGTFGGNTYYQMNKTPVIGAGTNFTINANGYIAQFITNAGDPALLNIPAGNWTFEMYFSASSSGGTPTFYLELYKYDGATFTLISSGSTSPELISGGTVKDVYFTALTVPATSLTLTDRLAVRVYVNHSGRTITLHTEDNNLCQIITTFTTGISAINSLTAQVQYLTTGTSGTDFNISSLTDTHIFNLPVASATNTGKLSSADWTTFNNKGSVSSVATNTGTGITGGTITTTGTLAIDTNLISTRAWRQKGIDSVTSLINARPSGSGTTNYLAKWTGSTALGNSLLFDNSTLGNVGINTASPASTLEIFKSTGTNYLYVTNGTSGTLNGVVLRWNSVDYMGMIGNFNSGEFKVGGFNAGGYFMTFYSNNAERMRLTPSGRLLIGTSTESTFELDIVGDIRSTLDANINGLTVGKGGGNVSTSTAIGNTALFSNISSAYNTAVGYYSLRFATGGNNTALGALSGDAVNTGSRNTYLGQSAAYLATSGSDNVAIGYSGGGTLTTGSGNIFIGSLGLSATFGVTTGSWNTIIGGQISGLSSSLSNTIILADGQGNQRLYIDNIGEVGIGTTNPTYLIDVNGTARVSGTELRLDNGTTGTINLYSATPSIQFFSGDPTGYRLYRSSTSMALSSGGTIVLQISGNNGYTLDATNGHQWRTALSGGAALARLTTGGNFLIGTTTDAGFRLDVNGTARVSSDIYANNSALGFGAVRVRETSTNYGVAVHPNGSTSTFAQYNASSLSFWNGTVASSISQISGGLWFDVGASNSIFNRVGNTHTFTITSGGVVAGSTALNASAVLEAVSTTKGFLPPRMTGAQAEAIATPAAGLMVYANNGNGTTITSTGWWGYNGTTWVKLN